MWHQILLLAAAVSTPSNYGSGLPPWLSYFGLAIGAAGTVFVALNYGARQRDQATIKSQDQYITTLERANQDLQNRNAAMVPGFAREIATALAEFVPKIIDAVDARDERRDTRRQERGRGT